MFLKYFYDRELAHASYLIGCQKTGEAIVIDPSRSIRCYLETAQQANLTIVGSAETHIHADYLSGSHELAYHHDVELYVSDEGPADWKYSFVQKFKHHLLRDGDEFRVGNILIQVLHTPGHTPESLSYLVTDLGGGATKPMGIFTGDFVFVGSIGRPDLLEEATGEVGAAKEGAIQLYRSIQKFKELPDYLQVWPSHGAGSACGKGLGAIPSSTVGYEKMVNESLQFSSESEFVEYILADQPEAPPYFALMKQWNKQGPDLIKERATEKLPAIDLPASVSRGQVIDVRKTDEFAKGHVPGAINLPVKSLARHGGWLIDYQKPIFLIADELSFLESKKILAEIGIDNLAGFFEPEDLVQAGLENDSYSKIQPSELSILLAKNEVTVVDVRRQTEWDQGHIPGANHHFLGRFPSTLSKLSSEKPVVFQCQTGIRSAIACSLALAAGLKNVLNLEGGIVNWELNQLPLSSPNSKLVEVA